MYVNKNLTNTYSIMGGRLYMKNGNNIKKIKNLVNSTVTEDKKL